MTEFQELVLKLQDIKRYHTGDLLRTQNVAEHSFNVAMIALETALWVSDFYPRFPPFWAERVMLAAALHDFGENFVGDVEYWVKKDNPEVKKAIKDVENSSIRSFISRSPHYLKPIKSFAFSTEDGNTIEHLIIKQADYLELIHYCVQEVKRGNTKAERIVEGGFMALEYYQHPDLDHVGCPLRILQSGLSDFYSLRKGEEVHAQYRGL